MKFGEFKNRTGTARDWSSLSQGYNFVPGVLSSSEISGELNLPSIKARSWFVWGACATTGEGIQEAIQQMARLVKDFRENRHHYL